MKKRIIFILFICCLVLSGCVKGGGSAIGSKKRFNLDYFGNITIGDKTFSMDANDDDLVNAGFKKTVHTFTNPNTSEKFTYYYSGGSTVRIQFTAYNDVIKNAGFSSYNDITNNIKLPKNITFISTIDDVKKAYGTPSDEGNITSYDGIGTINVKIQGKELEYYYEDKNTNDTFQLDLYFENNKLYMVRYILDYHTK